MFEFFVFFSFFVLLVFPFSIYFLLFFSVYSCCSALGLASVALYSFLVVWCPYFVFRDSSIFIRDLYAVPYRFTFVVLFEVVVQRLSDYFFVYGSIANGASVDVGVVSWDEVA